MSYKERLIEMNTSLANHSKCRFIGYGLKKSRANGTLIHASDNQIIETPIAENLVIGMAQGLSLDGLYPVAFIERMDFILNAMDALTHIDHCERISKGEFSSGVIIRTVVGSRNKPLYTGIPHTQDYTQALRQIVTMSVFDIKNESEIEAAYELAMKRQNEGQSTILVEYRDLM